MQSFIGSHSGYSYCPQQRPRGFSGLPASLANECSTSSTNNKAALKAMMKSRGCQGMKASWHQGQSMLQPRLLKARKNLPFPAAATPRGEEPLSSSSSSSSPSASIRHLVGQDSIQPVSTFSFTTSSSSPAEYSTSSKRRPYDPSGVSTSSTSGSRSSSSSAKEDRGGHSDPNSAGASLQNASSHTAPPSQAQPLLSHLSPPHATPSQPPLPTIQSGLPTASSPGTPTPPTDPHAPPPLPAHASLNLPTPATSSSSSSSNWPHSSSTPSITGTGQAHSSTSTSTSSSPDVEAAVARAQAALSQLESSLDSIPQLPSAAISSRELPMPPLRRAGAWARTLAIARNVAVLGAGGVALLASHAFGLAVQLLSAVAGAVAIAYWGHRRGSLSASGAVVAFMVGVGTLCCSLRFGATLLAFFFASSKLTHWKEDVKAKLDDNARKGGQRDWRQVLCNGLVPTGVAVAYGLVAGCVDVPLGPSPQLELWRAKVLTLLGGAYLGWYACCCGDTWASEIGPLSPAPPRLITSLRPVRRGTNGGVTMLGLAASLAGGTFVGLVFYLAGLVSPTLWIFESQRATAACQWLLIPLGTLAGLVGSLVDSLLGATVQFSGYNQDTSRVTSTPGPSVMRITGTPLLDNNLVNVVSATITAALTACAAFWVFGA